MNDGANPVHHVLEKTHEVCDREGVGLQLDILDEPIQRHLPIEFCEGDAVLWAGADAGAGWWSGVGWRWSAVRRCREKVVPNGWGLCMDWRVEGLDGMPGAELRLGVK